MTHAWNMEHSEWNIVEDVVKSMVHTLITQLGRGKEAHALPLEFN